MAQTLGRRNEPGGVIVATCDFTPKWHAKSGKLLGTGQTVRYLNDKVIAERDRETSYSVYDQAARTWTPWTTLDMPDKARFQNAGAGSVQRVDLPNGDILLPIYFKNKSLPRYRTTVLRCSFDGQKLKYEEQGSEMTIDVGRGLYEPSLTVYQGRYYLTLRNDEAGYVATSKDGLAFDEPQKMALGRRHGPGQLQHPAALGHAQRRLISGLYPQGGGQRPRLPPPRPAVHRPGRSRKASRNPQHRARARSRARGPSWQLCASRMSASEKPGSPSPSGCKPGGRTT